MPKKKQIPAPAGVRIANLTFDRSLWSRIEALARQAGLKPTEWVRARVSEAVLSAERLAIASVTEEQMRREERGVA